jgi:hypothetical protein
MTSINQNELPTNIDHLREQLQESKRKIKQLNEQLQQSSLEQEQELQELRQKMKADFGLPFNLPMLSGKPNISLEGEGEDESRWLEIVFSSSA